MQPYSLDKLDMDLLSQKASDFNFDFKSYSKIVPETEYSSLYSQQ